MTLNAGRARRDVGLAFERLSNQMQDMHPNCQIKPNDGTVITAGQAGSDVRVECAPVVCRVPERASHSSADLYVVLTGQLILSGAITDELQTVSYGTNFGYFIVKRGGAQHVFGGHYDFTLSQTAHPRAHLQIRSQADMYGSVQQQFRSIATAPMHADRMTGVLTRVRPPSAQMDFLSFMLQVCADHLVDEGSPDRVERFMSLSASCSPVRGYNTTAPGRCECHRAAHWYPSADVG